MNGVEEIIRNLDTQFERARVLLPQIKKAAGNEYKEMLGKYYLKKYGTSSTKMPYMPEVSSVGNFASIARRLYEGDVKRFSEPICWTGNLPSSLIQRVNRDEIIPAIECYEVKDVQLDVSFDYRIPVCVAGKGDEAKLIAEFSSANADALILRGGIESISSSGYKLNRLGVIFDSFLTTNYCHWLVDWIPRLHLLEQFGFPLGKLNFFVPGPLAEFQKETLRKAGVPSENVIERVFPIKQAGHSIRFSGLVGTSTSFEAFRHACYAASPWAIDYVRGLFLSKSLKKGQRKLFIDRKGVRKLRITGERKGILDKAGFETVYLEDYSVEQQAILLSEATHVVAIHGAGLANVVFCEPETKILEIFSPYHATPAFMLLSSGIHANYSCAVGTPIENGIDPLEKKSNLTPASQDFSIDGAIIEGWIDS